MGRFGEGEQSAAPCIDECSVTRVERSRHSDAAQHALRVGLVQRDVRDRGQGIQRGAQCGVSLPEVIDRRRVRDTERAAARAAKRAEVGRTVTHPLLPRP